MRGRENKEEEVDKAHNAVLALSVDAVPRLEHRMVCEEFVQPAEDSDTACEDGGVIVGAEAVGVAGGVVPVHFCGDVALPAFCKNEASACIHDFVNYY